MRIVGYIPHPIMKITVMQMSERFVLKLEVNSIEQTYKFNEDDNLRTMKDIEKVVDEIFLMECLKRFSEMNKSVGEAYQRNMV
ncbi:MAG TPA: hypothetical protein PLL99_05285 [Chitinophagales bacterium]|jgi:hypothetical protein|nr:hypothetical protein [Chitinophagales bacterium]HQG38103.1 hypothetical protein [Chitinophagales bacterium]